MGVEAVCSRPDRKSSQNICEDHLKGKCSIEVIGLLQNPQLNRETSEGGAKNHGDLSDTYEVLIELDLRERQQNQRLLL
jgi:hypothetical protein